MTEVDMKRKCKDDRKPRVTGAQRVRDTFVWLPHERIADKHEEKMMLALVLSFDAEQKSVQDLGCVLQTVRRRDDW